jgi:hypothetical protein
MTGTINRYLRLPVQTQTIAGLLLCLLVLTSTGLSAQESLEPRLQIGINLLPAVIAANKAIINSKPNTELPIYLVYDTNRYLAERLQQRLAKLGAIHKRQLVITSLPLDLLLEIEPQYPSSIFIVEPVDNRLQGLIEYSRKHRALLFSPFQGDVERGANAGFQVTDKVLPMVNMSSLKQSKIQLKAFFLRIAVKHE